MFRTPIFQFVPEKSELITVERKGEKKDNITTVCCQDDCHILLIEAADEQQHGRGVDCPKTEGDAVSIFVS